MTEDADPYARAVAALAAALADGRLGPGDAVPAIRFAEILGLSPTPVREALAYLCGRGLLERHHRHGYRAPLLSAGDLVDLFDLQSALLAAASSANPLAGTLLKVIEIRLSPLARMMAARNDPDAALLTPTLGSRAELAARRDRLVARAEPLARALKAEGAVENNSPDIV